MANFGVSLFSESSGRVQVDSQEMWLEVSMDAFQTLGDGNSNGFSFFTTPTSILFWHRTRGDDPSPPQGVAMLTHLSSTFDRVCPVLLQLRTPIKTKRGRRTMLRVAKQPFGFGSLYAGLCTYRRHCVERESNGGDDHGEIGPPERVFRQEFPEYCPDIECYSTEEFPTRDFAKSCGIVSYYALPVFKYDGTGSKYCVAVLECLSMENFIFSNHVLPAISAFQVSNLPNPDAHLHECEWMRKLVIFPFPHQHDAIKNVLELVREEHQLPVIHAWLPCVCEHVHQRKLFCDMRICSKNLRYLSEFDKYNSIQGSYSVKNGECLVGRAYGKNMPCFSRDTTQFSLSDYPFIHLTRSSGLAACFVIPLKIVHPTLDSIFLEIFLPPDHHHNYGDPVAVLKPLLRTVSEGFSKLDIDVGLKKGEDFWAEVCWSDAQHIDYFSAKRVTCFDVDHIVAPTMAGDQVPMEVAPAMALATTSSFWESPLAISDVQMTGEQYPDAQDATNSYGEHQMTMDYLQPSLYAQGTGILTATIAQDLAPFAAHSFGNASIRTPVITREALEGCFGHTLEVVCQINGVKRSTLKRMCRDVGIPKWLSHARYRVTPIPRLFPESQTGQRLPRRSRHMGQ